jgi:hypothetical protein
MQHAVELCNKLKGKSLELEESDENRLRLKILDFFIDRNISDDVFEEVLTIRINDPDPTKKQSKDICKEILQAWKSRHLINTSQDAGEEG